MLHIPGTGNAFNSAFESPSMAFAGRVAPASYWSISARFTSVLRGSRLPQVFVGKVPEDPPVFERHGVLAGADVVAEPAVHELVERRDRLRVQAAGAEEAIHRIGRPQDLELPLWVRPQILFGVGEQHGPRGAQGDEAVLIERQPRR